MSRRTFLGGCVLTVAAAAGCYTGGSVSNRDEGPAAGATTTATSATDPAGRAIVGLPCDVATILAASCVDCHGPKLTGGAPNRMVSYEDLMATSITDGRSSVADVALARMKSTSAKLVMPPGGALPAREIKRLEAWIAAGSPRGECADVTVATTDYDTPLVCSSNTRWTRGDRGSVFMRPGGACIACHDRVDDAPSYTAAGTVYLTAHEPDDCDGIASTASEPTKVVITDANGKVFTTTVNEVGNFYFDSKLYPIEVPLRAKVVRGAKSREMKDAAMHGDCNKCHTVNGVEKAPGRVMAP